MVRAVAVASLSTTALAQPAPEYNVVFNETGEDNDVSANIALMGNDFVPMTREETLVFYATAKAIFTGSKMPSATTAAAMDDT